MEDWAETDLAWDLAEIAGFHIPEPDRSAVFTAIGAGDCYMAIDALLETIVQASVPVPPSLVARIGDWLNAYLHHAEARRLCELISAIK
ncbi:MAG: hypothetical protein ACXVBB_20840 [Isosphaeraceae bacterium]